MDTWRYAVLLTVIFLVTGVPAIIGLYWLLYIYPYDRNRTQNVEESEEHEWVVNPIHNSAV